MPKASGCQELGRASLVFFTLVIGFLIPWLLFRTDKDETQFVHEPVSYVFVALFLFAAGAVMFTFEVEKINVKHLKWWNGMLFVLHLASGVALAWLASTKGTWTAYVTFGRSQWGKFSNDTVTTAAPGLGPDGCQDGGCFVRTVPCLLSEANIEYMVLAFHLLSTLQHLAVVLDWGEHYSKNIQNGNHWMRWFEYAFSASIMFASWAFLCGITDVIALVPLCVCVGTTQMFGYFSDAAARVQWLQDPRTLETQYRQIVAGLMSCLTKLSTCFEKVLLSIHTDDFYMVVYYSYDLFQFGTLASLFAYDNKAFVWFAAFIALGGIALSLLKLAPHVSTSESSTFAKSLGVLYVTYAAVLAWPMVTRDVDTLRVVTQVVLVLHILLSFLNVVGYKDTIYPIKVKITQERTLLNGINSLNVSFIDPIWIFTLAWVPYLLGAWFMTVAVFHDSLRHPGPNAEDPPDALYVIIVTQFLFFSCFAGAQIWYLWKPSRQRYLDTEFYFCLLSLVSKTALAWSLYSGASGRKNLGLRAPGAGGLMNNATAPGAEIQGLALPWC